ncbi:MAG: hypothetical protein FWD40_01225 [Treponema sp.]|nr:hypothetical protein [Treponema sp.]
MNDTNGKTHGLLVRFSVCAQRLFYCTISSLLYRKTDAGLVPLGAFL